MALFFIRRVARAFRRARVAQILAYRSGIRAFARYLARKELRAAAIARQSRIKILGIRVAELVEEAAELEQQANDIVEAAYYEAIDTMQDMIGNAGQQTVFNDHVIPAFASTLASTEIGDNWDDVNIGEYMSFMGEIVAEGNAIMEKAYEEAQSLTLDAENIQLDIESEEEALEELEREEAQNRT